MREELSLSVLINTTCYFLIMHVNFINAKTLCDNY